MVGEREALAYGAAVVAGRYRARRTFPVGAVLGASFADDSVVLDPPSGRIEIDRSPAGLLAPRTWTLSTFVDARPMSASSRRSPTAFVGFACESAGPSR